MFVDIIEAPKLYWHYAETLFHAATYPLNWYKIENMGNLI